MLFPNNQYLIVHNRDLKSRFILNFKNNNEVRRINWCEHTVLVSNSLNVEIENNNHAKFILLGYIIDPFSPQKSNSQIIRDIANNFKDIEELFDGLSKYSGRYVMFVRNNKGFYGLVDACGLRQIYYSKSTYSDNIIYSSMPDLILKVQQKAPKLKMEVKTLITSSDFKHSESQWFGDKWYDEKIKKVLPNYYYDSEIQGTKRMDFNIDDFNTRNEIIEYSKKILTGSIEAITNRYKVIQPLTGGYDSRVLLSASKQYRNKITYYLFHRGTSTNSDRVVAERISNKLGINFNIITPPAINSEFKEIFDDYFIFPRYLSKTANIQWHYFHHRDEAIVNVSGNASGIAKRVYINNSSMTDLNYLISLTKQPNIFQERIKKWYDETNQWAIKHNIDIMDLFYWEQRMGNWGALYALEQDIAIEEFFPFSNRQLLFSLLNTQPSERSGPNYLILKELMNEMWSETLTFKFNPIIGWNLKQRLNKLLVENTVLYNFYKKFTNSY